MSWCTTSPAPFEGGFTGYERMTIAEDGELVATWSDSGSEESLVTRGSWDAESNTLTMQGRRNQLDRPGEED